MILFSSSLCYNKTHSDPRSNRSEKYQRPNHAPTFFVHFLFFRPTLTTINLYRQAITMNHITLQNNQATYTIIPNRFLDDYMPRANGEFVKVYLYLLRNSNTDSAISISGIADQMNHTENDVLRALRYWEQEGLLKLTFHTDASLTGITLCDYISKTAPTTKEPAAPTKESYLHKEEPTSQFAIPPKQNYTNTQLQNFLNSEDIEQILYVAQKYLGITLSDTDTNTILYFYDGLHFSADLIEYLIEYCVSIGQRSMRYIEKVALSWAEKGYRTVSEAKNNTTTYSKNCFAIMKSFGINNRRPGNSEMLLIQKWTNEYEFTIDIITEACNRTIRSIHQPSFEYADRILTKWKKQGVKYMTDIIEQDKQFVQNTTQGKDSSKKPDSRPSNNRFNNVTPRNYAYDDLEKQLLNH